MEHFGLPKKEKEIIENYIGKYVIIYPSNGGNSFAGRMTGIQDGFAKLNPHQGGICTNKGIIKKLINKESIVNLNNINGIEPLTKESLENFCELYNNQNKK